ncbi:hypothetical protein TcYC6_0090860 [Trypanosoma cruzi]|uniref:Beta-fructofuranosidase-like protein n=1 Tax=Trypanosoma cruzi TaxID=5693 RepID=A0A7J6YC20_TRYCR|nr:hypothetical protein ECC02_002590 [Trypanosoma cruzi]KAF8296264.1 hypothetical protein TcYC6_0090860 [Trypanosoma cruzi]
MAFFYAIFWVSLTVLLLQCCVPQWLTVQASNAMTNPDLRKVSLSLLGNLHYDVLFGKPGGYGVCNQGQPSIATPGCDSPLKLIRSAMRDVSQWKDSFTLITGGLLRHGTDTIATTEIESMMKDVVVEIANSSRESHLKKKGATYPVALSFGGTDFIPANSFSPEGKQPHFTRLLNLLELYELLNSQESKKLGNCGYFFRDLNGTKLRVISLNTLLWSNALRPGFGVGDVDPCGQFPFLQGAIEQAKQRGRSVIILGDTPPVINVADALRKSSVQEAESYWREDFTEAYFRIIATYRFSIAAQFFGHTNSFAFVDSPEVGPPLYIVPPISPVTGSNPSYLRATLDTNTGRVVTLKQRYLSENGKWVEGESLEDAIGAPLREMGESLPKDLLLITESEKKWEKLAAMRVGGRFLTERGACSLWCRRVIACASLYYSKMAIERCASIDLPSQRLGLILAIVFTCFGMLMITFSFGYMISHYKIIFHPPVVVGAGKGRHRLFLEHTEEEFS